MAQLKDTVVSGNLRVTDTVLADSVQADEIKKTGGTSSQFLKADGSVDSNTYALASAVSTPGTLNTNISTAQTTNTSEALSGTILLHKVSKTGSYSDLLNKPNEIVVLSYTTSNAAINITSSELSGAYTAARNALSANKLPVLRICSGTHYYDFQYAGNSSNSIWFVCSTPYSVDQLSLAANGGVSKYTRDIPSALGEVNMTSTTWSGLKTLRDGGNLVPGMQYRITDYTCTTVQTDTQSAGHVFDIIVVADSETKLNEYARAALHSGDTYFSGNKLEKWELKYRLDNDTTEFAWADSTNGKGVIYWMKDDGGNECTYDFKNIQFKPGAKTKAKTKADVFYYTFSVATGTNDSTVTDHSLNTTYCYLNKLELYKESDKQTLSLNVFRNTSSSSTCYNNVLSFGSKYNTFGTNCSSNKFANYCHHNDFGDACNNNVLGTSCYYNDFGNYCNYNVLGAGVQYCSLGYSCESNTFVQNNRNNVMGNYCNNNTFECLSSYCTLGSTCTYNVFGINSFYIKFGTSDTVKSYYQYIVIDPGNKYIYLNFTENSSSPCRNIRIAQGVNNTTTWKTITDTNVNQTYQTIYQPANSKIISV